MLESCVKHKKCNKKWMVLTSIALVLAVLIIWGFYAGLVLRKYEITSSKIPADVSVRIAVIADLHSHIYGQDQQPLIDMIRDEKPDLIALVGDIVDDHDPRVGAKMFLQDVADIAPAYYVSGNHEYWSGKCGDIKNMIRGYGVIILENERRYINIDGTKICLCGIDDPEVFEYTDDKDLLGMEDMDDTLWRFFDLEDSTLNILLAHRPELAEDYAKYEFDLVLSGHAHGGQIRIPLVLNGLFAPGQGLFPKYAGGLYKFDDMTMIVSRGLSFNARIPRVFNPPEVVVVDIKGGL